MRPLVSRAVLPIIGVMRRTKRHRARDPVERLLRYGITVAALLVFFALALGAARAKSPTNDEPIHLTRGAALRQIGSLALQYEHTPLSHRLIGTLLATERTLPPVVSLQSWASGDRVAIADELLWASGVDVERLLFLGRLPIIWTGLLLGAFVALWTRAAARHTAIARQIPFDLRTEAAALAVVMSLFAFNPNLLASAALATTDFVATVTYFVAVGAWWFFWRRPTWQRWAATAVLLGLALSAKLTGVLLIPLLVVLAYAYLPRRPWWRPGLLALALVPVASLVVWAVYGLQLGEWRGLLVPAPAYWSSWDAVLGHIDQGHQAYFLGQLSDAGWWLYFPVTFLIKTPFASLLLIGAAIFALLRRRATRPFAAFVLLPAGMLFAAAVYSRLNLGYRHILPAVPFLLVAVGASLPLLWPRRAVRWAIGVAVLWVAVVTLYQQPHQLAYFNEMVGGSSRGYLYLGDSNLDWGQDLKALSATSRAMDGPLFASYGGVGDPDYYGLEANRLVDREGLPTADFSPANPAPGRYAISAGHWQGLLPESSLYDWFRRRRPDGNIGYSILLYDVSAQQEGSWIAQCLAPAPLLSTEEAERILGRPKARHVTFDCENAWVFPENGAPGWYILPVRDEPWWIEQQLDTELPQPVYRHTVNQFGPAFDVYYWPGKPGPIRLRDQGDAPPTDGPATLEGYVADGNEWLTSWHVSEISLDPLSIQAHLLTDDGTRLVADGLGYATDQWQPGDRFIQRHVFTAPGEQLETGLYNYITLEPVGTSVSLSR